MQKKKNIYLILLIITIIILYSNFVFASPPQVGARAAIVMDIKTGQVLYNKHMNVKMPPASTTKILTAIIAIEEGNLEDTVTISRKAAYQEGSSIWLKEGEELSLEELLYGVMLSSANDAAIAVAEHIAGSVTEFVELMNEKAKEIGANKSNFLNPNGLPCTGHYSNAYDLAKIMSYALKNNTFAQITATKYKTISWDDNTWDRGLRNHNRLLWSYKGITGGKTGYTKAAGRCLVTSASRQGREVVAVVLNCASDWHDCKRLMDYGIENFKYEKVFTRGDKICSLTWEETAEKDFKLLASKSLYVTVPKGGKISVKKVINILEEKELPVKKNEKLGYISVYHKDKLIDRIELVTDRELNFNSLFRRLWHNLTLVLKNNFNKGLNLSLKNIQTGRYAKLYATFAEIYGPCRNSFQKKIGRYY